MTNKYSITLFWFVWFGEFFWQRVNEALRGSTGLSIDTNLNSFGRGLNKRNSWVKKEEGERSS